MGMPHEKFSVAHLDRLNDPGRFEYLPPAAMWEALGNPSPQTIVDVGAGTGLFACWFAEAAPDATVYAIDIEPAMVRWMLEHRHPSLCSRLQPLLGKESAIPLATGEADLVVMINLHHELVDPHASYREALRLTRIGGQLLVVDWTPDGEEPGPPHHVRVTADQIADLASAVGFDQVTIHPPLPRHSLITARKPVICSL
jgi:ubiquinone/menaquinone biosynthesis C-methylase UbiE